MYFAEIIEYRNKIIKISKTTNAKSYKTQVLSSIEKEKNKVNHHTRILTMTYVKEALKFLDMPHKTFYIRSKGKSEKIATILKNMKNKTMNKSDIEYLCKYLNLLQYEECQELIQYLPEIFIIYGKNFTFFNGLFKEKYQVQLIIPLYKHIYYYNFIVEFHNICKVSLDFLSENLKGEILAFNQTLQMLQEEQEITSLHAERDHNIRLLCQLYILNTQEYSLLEGGISKINNLSQEEREEMIIEMLSNICKVFEIFEKTPSKLPSILHEFIYSFYTICALTFLLGTNISNLHYH